MNLVVREQVEPTYVFACSNALPPPYISHHSFVNLESSYASSKSHPSEIRLPVKCSDIYWYPRSFDGLRSLVGWLGLAVQGWTARNSLFYFCPASISWTSRFLPFSIQHSQRRRRFL
ncbi:hypothetical protein D9758_011000 [Tetrapyrgos nigripes]|uniref:Uncharacterized protein n=1 Tax=Tetrapyrgos nigripes TaxID=182062 RepID=A0A8H5GI12_9AGAR|nr:hypothetical protein D9758_011000 [Tetrapyrgos nigripes]